MRCGLFALALILASSPSEAAPQCDPSFAATLPRIVSREDMAAVNETYEINLWQFCSGKEFHDLGNAAALTRFIAANPVLNTPIQSRGWRADDVMFVRISPARVDLWLHRDP